MGGSTVNPFSIYASGTMLYHFRVRVSESNTECGSGWGPGNLGREGKGGKKEGGEVRGENGVIAKQAYPLSVQVEAYIHLPHPHLTCRVCCSSPPWVVLQQETSKASLLAESIATASPWYETVLYLPDPPFLFGGGSRNETISLAVHMRLSVLEVRKNFTHPLPVAEV